jgi:hypothetical protein
VLITPMNVQKTIEHAQRVVREALQRHEVKTVHQVEAVKIVLLIQ